MNRLPKLLVALFVVALLVTLTTPALAGEMKGKIMSVDPDKYEFVLKTPGNRMLTFVMDEDATVYINGEQAELTDLRPGEEVGVVERRDDGVWYAIVVRCERK